MCTESPLFVPILTTSEYTDKFALKDRSQYCHLINNENIAPGNCKILVELVIYSVLINYLKQHPILNLYDIMKLKDYTGDKSQNRERSSHNINSFVGIPSRFLLTTKVYVL